MKKLVLTAALLLSLAALFSCRRTVYVPRPTIDLVWQIVSDTASRRQVAATAGSWGPSGSIAIFGEPSDAMALGQHLASVDVVDNVDARTERDSIPDFAGEVIDIIMDSYNAPYSHFLDSGQEGLDSLRALAVEGAMYAWDSTSLGRSSDRTVRLFKNRAKILVFTSPLQARWGLFDADTLQQLAGGRCHLLSPSKLMLGQAMQSGPAAIVVWTSALVSGAGVYDSVFEELEHEGSSLKVMVPEAAFDIRTELRNLLRQARADGISSLDVLVIDSFAADPGQLESEIRMIRREGTEEDLAFSRMLSPSFRILTPAASVAREIYGLMRSENLFAHRIARPATHYFETDESDDGEIVIVELGARYVRSAYVPDFD